jgi:Tfp pilus assembly protein PilO
MSLSDRDRKILIGIVPLVVLVAYWFLLLSPKREEASTASTKLQEQVERRDSARAAMSAADVDKTDFASDYGEIVRLGKAIPARVDMPSLLVQLDRAADGTGITFTKISAGPRIAATPAASTPPADGAPAGTTPAAAGGAPAQSAPGGAAESANNAAATSDQANQAAENSGVSPADTQTSTAAREGGLPVGGAAGGTSAATGEAPVASGGLEVVPLELEFVGNFFRLADFFHDVKRFVHVVNNDVVVNGRLMTVQSVNFASDPEIFPRIKATMTASVYLSPLSQGVTAGATPAGPAAPATTPASTTPAPAPAAPAPATPAPTAAATP